MPSSAKPHINISIKPIFKKSREEHSVSNTNELWERTKADNDDVVDCKGRPKTDVLYQEIRQIQKDIDNHPNAPFQDEIYKDLKRKLGDLKARFSKAASDLYETDTQ